MGPRDLLLHGKGGAEGEAAGASRANGAGSEEDSLLVEDSPNDYFWGRGISGEGKNMLGRLLMQVREELKQGVAEGEGLLAQVGWED